VKSTNYADMLVTVSADCPVAVGTIPEKPETVVAHQYALLASRPYAMTSDVLAGE